MNAETVCTTPITSKSKPPPSLRLLWRHTPKCLLGKVRVALLLDRNWCKRWERLYDRQWALMVLEKAHQNLETEYGARGKSQEFKEVQPYLSSKPAGGEYRAIS